MEPMENPEELNVCPSHLNDHRERYQMQRKRESFVQKLGTGNTDTGALAAIKRAELGTCHISII